MCDNFVRLTVAIIIIAAVSASLYQFGSRQAVAVEPPLGANILR